MMKFKENQVISFVYNAGTRKGQRRTGLVLKNLHINVQVFDTEVEDIRNYNIDLISDCVALDTIVIPWKNLPSTIERSAILRGYHSDGYETCEYNGTLYAYNLSVHPTKNPNTIILRHFDKHMSMSIYNGQLRVNDELMTSTTHFLRTIKQMLGS